MLGNVNFNTFTIPRTGSLHVGTNYKRKTSEYRIVLDLWAVGYRGSLDWLGIV
jgi:hypothetical protein